MEGWLTSRYRLIAVVVLLLISGFTATNLINYYISRDAIRNSIVSNELPLSSYTIFTEIQADLLKPIFVSSLMAQDTFLRDWVIEGEKTPDAMQRYLNEIKNRYGAFTSYFISDQTLNYYHFSGLSRRLRQEDPADSWFWNIKKKGDPYEINLDYNKEQDSTLTVFINYRVMDYENNFIGVTGVGLGLESVRALIERYQRNFRRTIYFIDRQGQIQLHSREPADQPSIMEQSGLRPIAHQILSQEYGTFTYERDGELMLLTSRYIPELKWYLLVELKEADAVAEIRRSLFMNLGIGAAVILLISLIIAVTINGFHARLEQMATTDKLSGLGNRQYFDLILAREMQNFQRHLQPFSLILLDIDYFKKVNDQYGHAIGDCVIRQISHTIGDCIRASDSLCRWGGEEFVILAPDCTTSDARLMSEKIRLAVEQSLPVVESPELKVTLSAGVTMVHGNDTTSQIFSRADKALYRAKASGRNRVEAA